MGQNNLSKLLPKNGLGEDLLIRKQKGVRRAEGGWVWGELLNKLRLEIEREMRASLRTATG